MINRKIIIGTRKSALARWQSEHVKTLLEAQCPGVEIYFKEIITQGDRSQQTNTAIPVIGGKGIFTAELEAALSDSSIDIAVHSLKDLPTEMDAAFTIAAIPQRDSPYDALVSRNGTSLKNLKAGAVIGTSSPRRESQLRKFRSDFIIKSVRGNVDTRIAKLMVEGGEYDAMVLAEAGLNRIGRAEVITERLAPPLFLPAPGQGALAVQCSSANKEIIALVAKVDNAPTRMAVAAERAFLKTLEAGCSLPVAAFAEIKSREIKFIGRAIAHDGSRTIEISMSGIVEKESDAYKIGEAAARQAFSEGFRELMACAHSSLVHP